MPTLLEETRRKFTERLKELEPYLQEARELEEALAAMGKGPAGNGSSAPKAPPKTRRVKASTGRARRGERREQMIEFLRGNPTAGPSAAAKQLGISPSQASNLLRRLKSDGRVSKRGNRWTVKA